MSHSDTPFLQKFLNFLKRVFQRMFEKKSTKIWVGTILFSASVAQLLAQAYPTPRHSLSEWQTDRLLILGETESKIHPELKPFSRKDVAGIALEKFTTRQYNTARKTDRAIYQYLADDNSELLPKSYIDTTIQTQLTDFQTITNIVTSEKALLTQHDRPIFGHFYKTPAHLFEVATPHFKMTLNPMLNLTFGAGNGLDSLLLFANQRGLEIRGSIDKRVYFFSNVLESQVRFPEYVNRYVRKNSAIPGNGLFKNFGSKIFNAENSLDFANAQAAVGFEATQHVSVELGHGRHFWGNGYRSLFLSDFAHNNFYLKLNTRVWKFNYQNLFMELTPSAYKPAGGDSILPKKYAAMHYLNFKVNKNLAFGFFEATVFNRSQNFEFQYLNPIILYRTVEQAIGSPDNILVGLDWRWNFAEQFQFYGQIMLDEFNFDFIFKPSERGWWGNKHGFQAGLKYINVLKINNLDAQIELNTVRPFTYGHGDTLNTFTHYRQPLAHPMNANFREFIGILRYQPIPKLTLQTRVLLSKYGENTSAENWGNDLLVSTDTRTQDFGNKMFQGVTATQMIFGAEINYQIYHNLFLDFRWLLRDKDSADDRLDLRSTIFGAGVRMNLWNQNLDF